ncbi:zinc-binding dehydrogenase [Bacillus sp. FJAT-49736]|uniref:zinc-binding dehydrogenase n=1 Tax=Bacillus sp. FJAT-49736 TaxID=2833582 RepID=UPI001BCA4798|nr:zinc-binding dehydrogenase [Bacillus sp. FJAT-49736]MBS4175238.1 zinc-binding dehydrogenase [Bacillus sp. FJAT-49736]
MKAVIYSKESKSVVVRNKDIPQIGSGEVLVRLKAAALNHRELKIISYFNKQINTNPPFEEPKYIFGSDGAGVIVQIGENASSWKVNDEVLIDSTITCGVCIGCKDKGICESLSVVGSKEQEGTFSEYIKVPIKSLIKKPSYMNFEEAAALSMGLGTAWRSIVTKGNIQKGESVLIHGIGGGVALFALQIAKRKGANIIVTSSSDEKLAEANKLGASKTINYTSENVAEEVRYFTNGRGVDVIIDGIGASTFKMNIEAAAKDARVVNYGFTNSNVPCLDMDAMNQIYEKEMKFLEGSVHLNKDEIEKAISFWAEHQLYPKISHSFKLDKIAKAYETLKRGKQLGKIVITM